MIILLHVHLQNLIHLEKGFRQHAKEALALNNLPELDLGEGILKVVETLPTVSTLPPTRPTEEVTDNPPQATKPTEQVLETPQATASPKQLLQATPERPTSDPTPAESVRPNPIGSSPGQDSPPPQNHRPLSTDWLQKAPI